MDVFVETKALFQTMGINLNLVNNAINIIDSPDLDSYYVDRQHAIQIFHSGIFNENTLNIYIVSELSSETFSVTKGVVYSEILHPKSTFADDFILIDDDYFDTYTLPHELGHYFGLLHTWGTSNYNAGGLSVTDERIDRINNPNCGEEGDMLCDTPADPGNGFYNGSCGVYSANFPYEFVYPFRKYAPDANNMMTYINTNSNCSNRSFTADQIGVMTDFASNERSYNYDGIFCGPDSYEPSAVNDPNEWAFANILTNNTSTSIQATISNKNDYDVYKIIANGIGILSIDLTSLKVPSNLYLYNSNGVVEGAYIAKSEGYGVSDENIYYTISNNGLNTYYILVLPQVTYDINCNNNSYKLEVGLNTNSSNCQDQHESNDTKINATKINLVQNLQTNFSSIISSDTDIDYMKVDVNNPGVYRFSLSNLPADYDMEVSTYSGNNRWSNLNFGTQSEYVDIEIQDPLKYYIKVSGWNGVYNCDESYRITVRKIADLESPCNDNLFEPNESLQNAKTPFSPVYTVPYNENIAAKISSDSDRDFFKLAANGRGVLNINLSSLPQDYDLKVYEGNIYNTKGESNNPGMQDETVSIIKDVTGGTVYYIEVLGFNGLHDCDETYILNVDWQPQSSFCPGDQYEISDPNAYLLTLENAGGGQKQKNINATIHNSTDIDYYYIKIEGTGRLESNLSQLPENYDLSIGYFYGGDYHVVDRSQKNGTRSEFVEYVKNSHGSQNVIIGVSSPYDQYNCDDEYRLYIRWIPDESNVDDCPDSQYEPDNTIATANNRFSTQFTESESKTVYGYIGSSTDVDFYEINSYGKGELHVSLSSLPSNYDLDFVAADGTVIASSKNNGTTSEEKSVYYTSNQWGRVYLKIYAPFGSYTCTESYKLTVSWTNLSSVGCPQKDNVWENNDTPSKASGAFPYASNQEFTRTINDAYLHDDFDEDYFRLNSNTSGLFVIHLDDYGRGFEIKVTDANGHVLKETNNSTLYFSVTSIGHTENRLLISSRPGTWNCNKPYILTVSWIPSSNITISEGGFDPCENVISLDEQIPDQNRVIYEGNLINGTDTLSEYGCVFGVTGKEMIFSFRQPSNSSTFSMILEGSVDDSMIMQLYDDCSTFGTNLACSEDYDTGQYISADNLVGGELYYLFVDGHLDGNSPFKLSLPTVFYTTVSDARNIFYQCTGNNYNVIIDFKEEITNFQVNGFNWNYLDDNRYIVLDVNSIQFEASYFLNETKTIFIDSYECPKASCDGINPPAAPAVAVNCPGDDIPTAEIYNPDTFEVLWYKDVESTDPIASGDSFTPDDYGVYFVQFKDDAQDCESDKIPVEFYQEEELVVDAIISDNQCADASDGAIELIIDKDTRNFSFDWSTGDVNTQKIEGLPSGDYSVSITTEYGCEYEYNYKVSSPEVLRLSETDEPQHLCGRDDNVLLDGTVTGGTPPYQYFWNTGSQSAAIDVNEGGFYQLQVIDSTLCTARFDFNVTQSIPSEQIFLHQLSGDDNLITVIYPATSNGKWNTGSSENTINITETGWYWYESENDEGCIFRDSTYIEIYQPLEIDANIMGTNCDQENGSIEITSTGGVAPILYSLDTSALDQVYRFDSLAMGTYLIKVRDIHGNYDSTYVEIINDQDPIEGQLNYDADENQISLEVQNAIPPYEIYWNGEQTDSQFYSPIVSGVYNVELIDVNECTFTESINIELSNISEDRDKTKFSVYPNPFQDELILELSQQSRYTINIFNNIGEMVKSETIEDKKAKLDMHQLSPSIYYIMVNDESNSMIGIQKVIKMY